MSKSEAAKPVKAKSKTEQKVEAAVDKWFVDNFHNSVVSRDTAVHNLIHDAKPALITALVEAVSQSNQE